MDCERFDKVHLDLLYSELDELSAAAARRHLHHCSRCQDLWNRFRATKEVTEIPLEEPPEDLFESIIEAEKVAHRELPLRERLSRAVSVMAGYAMKPQLAMAAILLLMIASSLLFVRHDPSGHGKVTVTELGSPHQSPKHNDKESAQPLVFEGDRGQGTNSPSLEVPQEAAELGPQTTYAEAMSAYHEGRYAEAERLFSEVAAAQGEKAGSAALHQGHAARNGSGCQRAATLYDDVAEQYEGSPLGDEASWHAASCYQALGQLKRARSHYVGLLKSPAFAERARRAVETIDEQRQKQQLVEGSSPALNPTPDEPSRRVSRKTAKKPASSGKKAKPNEPTDPPAKEDQEARPGDSSSETEAGKEATGPEASSPEAEESEKSIPTGNTH